MAKLIVPSVKHLLTDPFLGRYQMQLCFQTRLLILIAMVAALLCSAAQCQTLQRAESKPEFRTAGIFTDHMVLQRDQPLPID